MDMASLAIVHQVPTVEEGGIAKQISAEELGESLCCTKYQVNIESVYIV